jgi:hypothetical protein
MVPILILHSILLPVNVIRLVQMRGGPGGFAVPAIRTVG